VLIVVPWSVLWERNAFVAALPFLHDVTSNHFVRGAVSGLGVVNVWAGFAELAGLMIGRTSSPPAASAGAQPQQEPIH
jgi:hypothetical protein